MDKISESNLHDRYCTNTICISCTVFHRQEDSQSSTKQYEEATFQSLRNSSGMDIYSCPEKCMACPGVNISVKMHLTTQETNMLWYGYIIFNIMVLYSSVPILHSSYVQLTKYSPQESGKLRIQSCTISDLRSNSLTYASGYNSFRYSSHTTGKIRNDIIHYSQSTINMINSIPLKKHGVD